MPILDASALDSDPEGVGLLREVLRPEKPRRARRPRPFAPSLRPASPLPEAPASVPAATTETLSDLRPTVA